MKMPQLTQDGMIGGTKNVYHNKESDDDLFEDSDENQEDLCTESSWDTTSDANDCEEEELEEEEEKNYSSEGSEDDSEKEEEEDVADYRNKMIIKEQQNLEFLRIPAA